MGLLVFLFKLTTMSDQKERYFNIPIQLLDGFLKDHTKVLENVCNYSLYSHSLKMEYGDEIDCFKSSASFYNVNFTDLESSFLNGKKIYDSIDESSPKVGLNLKIFWDFYSNQKKDFDKVCLLAYLALKSIIQKKPYNKLDNKFWLARMDGKARSCEFENLSPEIFKYHTEYQTKKIKAALVESWGLITYSKYHRGFYVSFTMKLEDLIYQAEKNRSSYKKKLQKQQENDAYEKAMARLEARP